MKTKLFLLALLSAFSLQPLALHAQGSLTPPGPPGATMLTLSQIEPRTPVDATHTGSGGSSEFLITQPGSYYLTTNVVGVSGLHGINISASDVTLNLNGFSLQGNSSAWDAIYIHAGWTNITVRNGTISGWSNASQYGNGVECHANNVALERLTIAGCGSVGITADNAVQLSHVQVIKSVGPGFSVGPGSTLEGCSAQGNGGDGFQNFDHCTFTTCTSLNNHGSGFNLLGPACSLISCVAGGNASYGFVGNNNCTFKECSATGNTNTGIYAITYSNNVVQNCTAVGNGASRVGDGISVGSGGVVRDCASANNASNGITAGNGCVIEDCTTGENNANGIYSSGGVITDCVASGNTNNGICAAGSVVRDCQVQGNTNGIYIFTTSGVNQNKSSIVSGCLAQNNANIGINVFADNSLINGNSCFGSGLIGILLDGNYCVADGNMVNYSGTYGIANYGINTIIKNIVSYDGVNNYFEGAPGADDTGPVGNASTSTSPWANISH